MTLAYRRVGERKETHLKAIFTRIPTPRNVQVKPLKRHKRRPPERQRSQIEGRQRLQVLGRLGTLQSQQPPSFQNLHFNLPFLAPSAIVVPFI